MVSAIGNSFLNILGIPIWLLGILENFGNWKSFVLFTLGCFFMVIKMYYYVVKQNDDRKKRGLDMKMLDYDIKQKMKMKKNE